MSDVLSDPLDRAQIELLLSLDDGDGAALLEIVDEYLAMSEEGRVELLGCLRAGDAQGAERAAHTLKGASANVGAAPLAGVCAAMEARARQGQPQGPHSSRSNSSPSSCVPGRPSRPSPRGREMRILIADDDPTSRLLLRAIVSKLGHECIVAEEGAERLGPPGVGWHRRAAHRLDDAGDRWARTVPARAGGDGRQLRVHRPDDGTRSSRACPGGHERRRRRLSDQARRLVRRSDAPDRGRTRHGAPRDTEPDPGGARASQHRAVGAVAH